MLLIVNMFVRPPLLHKDIDAHSNLNAEDIVCRAGELRVLANVPAEVDRRFRDAAAALDLIDVGYDVLDSPVGPLLVAASDRGIVRISYEPDPEEYLEHLARLVGPRVLRTPRPSPNVTVSHPYEGWSQYGHVLAIVASGTDVNGASRVFEIPHLDNVAAGEIGGRVTDDLTSLPTSAVSVADNNFGLYLGADGSLVGYGGGLSRKEQLLRLEGALL